VEKKVTEKKKENIKQGLIELTTKDYRVLVFDFDSKISDCENTHFRINFYTFPEHEMQEIFAFKYSFSDTKNLEKDLIEDGWGVYDPEREYSVDQGIEFTSPTCVSTIFIMIFRNSVAMKTETGSRKIKRPARHILSSI
jgi:hypothetical protein